MKRMHRNLILSIILFPILFLVECQVLLNALPRKLGLLILARGIGGVRGPEGGEQRDGGEEAEEDRCLETAADLPGEVVRNATEDGEKQDVAELLVAGTVGGEGCISNCRILGLLFSTAILH